MGKRKISFTRGPGGEEVTVSDDGKTTTFGDGTKMTRPEAGAPSDAGKPNAVSFTRRPGGERVTVSDDGKTTTYPDGTKMTRP
ncbi:hypothetical protein [Actinomadura mexicana]|uniref:Centromere protein J C-terminal domain-containing protein n=1 Tax=Actinomadura mexicana TaxID=134959 RepID=A0A239AA11_9ACTN|nr:hypothetical protein [Actinomadura mexicana]SNR92420.1 hypothetical protein SAMN06265355_108302 [Actinomadura mexicana]